MKIVLMLQSGLDPWAKREDDGEGFHVWKSTKWQDMNAWDPSHQGMCNWDAKHSWNCKGTLKSSWLTAPMPNQHPGKSIWVAGDGLFEWVCSAQKVKGSPWTQCMIYKHISTPEAHVYATTLRAPLFQWSRLHYPRSRAANDLWKEQENGMCSKNTAISPSPTDETSS